MKLRSVVVVMSAALIGATSSGFAQADHRDGHSRGDRQFSRGDQGGNFEYSDRGRRDGWSGFNAEAYERAHVLPQGLAPAYPPAGYGYGQNYGYGDYRSQFVRPGYYGPSTGPYNLSQPIPDGY